MSVRQMIGRSLRAPGFAVTVLLLTAAVVLVNATVFAAVWAIHYKALPYRDGDRLVELRADLSSFGFKVGLSRPLQEELSTAGGIYDGVAGYSTSVFRRADESGREWRVRRVTPNFSEMLGVAPVLGRALLERDAEQDSKVLLLSDAAWRTRFGADPGALGRDVVMGDQRYTVVGVMPAGFVFPDSQVDAWMPYVPSTGERNNDASGNVGAFEVTARLKSGVSLAQARDHLAAVFENATSLADLRRSAGLKPGVRFWRDSFADEHRLVLTLLQLASLILLAVVAANLANLVLDRMLARQRDLSICRALGARDRDIMRAVLGDLLPPAVLGVVVGVALLPLGIAVLSRRGLIPTELPVVVGGDAVTFVVAAMAALLVLGIALLAAMSVRSEANMATGIGVRHQASGLGRARSAMLVVQLALTTVLLGASALLLRSAVNLINEPRGFDERGVLMTSIDPLGVSRGLEFDADRDGERLKAGLLAIRAEVEALPGVRHAAFASMAPFSNWESVSTLRVPGVEGELQMRNRSVGTGYFSTLAIPFLSGRDFVEADLGEASPVIVDELFVRRWLAGRDPLTATIEVPDGPETFRSARIIGVVRTVKHESLDETPSLPTVYSLYPVTVPIGLLVTRVDGDPAALAESVRARVLAQFPDAVMSLNRPLSEAIARTLVSRRAALESVSAFAAVTLILVVLGLYAVLSFAVRRRTAELGVRMALGADSGDVLRMVLGQGAVLAGIGTALGLMLGLPLARLIADRLYGVGPDDPVTWALTTVVVALAALLACWWPARRAARMSPVLALQSSNQH